MIWCWWSTSSRRSSTAEPSDAQRFLDLIRSATGEDGLRSGGDARADIWTGRLAAVVRPRLQPGMELPAARRPSELGEAIVGPAHRAGVTVEPGLLAALVADVRGQPGALPLLQFTLAELFDRRDGAGQLTAAAYRDLGGVAGAVARGAEEVYAGLEPPGQVATRLLLVRLVDAGVPGFARRRVRRSELVPPGVDPADAEEVIAAFAARRLLAFDRDPDSREPTVEIAHDALLVTWSPAAGWVDEVRDALLEQERVAGAAREWEGAGRDASFLLRGVRLERAEALNLPGRRRSEFSSRLRSPSGTAPLARRRHVAVASVVPNGARYDACGRWSPSSPRASWSPSRSPCSPPTSVPTPTANGASPSRVSWRRPRWPTSTWTRSAACCWPSPRSATPGRDGDGALPEAVDALHRALGASRIVLRVDGLGVVLDGSPDGSLFVTEGVEESGVVDIRDARTGSGCAASTGTKPTSTWWPSVPTGRACGDQRRRWCGPRLGPAHGRAPAASGRQRARTGVGACRSALMVVGSRRCTGTRARSGSSDVRTGVQVFDVRARVVSAPGSDDFVQPGRRSPGGPEPRRRGGRARHAYRSAGARHGRRTPRSTRTTAPTAGGSRWRARGPTVRLLDATTGRLRHTVTGHRGDIIQADWSPDGRRLATGANDGTAKVWDVGADTVSEAMTINAQERGGGLWVAFGPDGTRLMQETRAPRRSRSGTSRHGHGRVGDAVELSVRTERGLPAERLRRRRRRRGRRTSRTPVAAPRATRSSATTRSPPLPSPPVLIAAVSGSTLTARSLDGSRLFRRALETEPTHVTWSPGTDATWPSRTGPTR